MTQPALFDLDAQCSRCQGHGFIRDYDGEAEQCPLCKGSGEQYDPETVEFPEGF